MNKHIYLVTGTYSSSRLFFEFNDAIAYAEEEIERYLKISEGSTVEVMENTFHSYGALMAHILPTNRDYSDGELFVTIKKFEISGEKIKDDAAMPDEYETFRAACDRQEVLWKEGKGAEEN